MQFLYISQLRCYIIVMLFINKQTLNEVEMRILICDDDPLMIEQLKKYCKSFFDKLHVKCPELSCFSDGESLLADKGDKDILFLDIEMPGMNGIYVGNELKKANSGIIIFIVTSYSEYLDEAMRFQVFRYLSKPIDKQRFFRNMKDAVELYNTITIKIPVETTGYTHPSCLRCHCSRSTGKKSNHTYNPV